VIARAKDGRMVADHPGMEEHEKTDCFLYDPGITLEGYKCCFIRQKAAPLGQPRNAKGYQGQGFGPEDKAGMRELFLQKQEIDKHPQGCQKKDGPADYVNHIALDLPGRGIFFPPGKQKKGEKGQYGEEDSGCPEMDLSGPVLRTCLGSGEPCDHKSTYSCHISRQIVPSVISPVEKKEKSDRTHGPDKYIAHPRIIIHADVEKGDLLPKEKMASAHQHKGQQNPYPADGSPQSQVRVDLSIRAAKADHNTGIILLKVIPC